MRGVAKSAWGLFKRAPGQEDLLTSALLRVGSRLLIVTAFLALVVRGQHFSTFLFRQDLPVLAAAGCLLIAMAIRPGASLRFSFDLGGRHHAASLIGAVFVLAAAGTWAVFGNHALSRDELLANFDADYLKQGLLVGPLPLEWRPFADAMMPLFMLDVAGNAGWISMYLPGNAALRAAADLIVGREWLNPLLAALGLFATYRIARRLWPDSREAGLVALLLLALSPQLLAMAMTPFAMTAHFALNCLWLLFFLRGDRRGDAGALVVGFVATGLHQLVFHPIFVLPFVSELLLARNWRRAALYLVGYAAIGLFWASYWQIVLAATGMATGGAEGKGLTLLAERVLELLLSVDPLNAFLLMLLNLTRFAAWQHLLLLPLVLLAWPAVRRGDGIARSLAGGIGLMLLTLLILLPAQGYGWGYRYLHGFLGSFALLAGYGWTSLASAADHRRRSAALAVASAVTLLVLLPFQLATAYQLVRPHREAQALIRRSAADVVLVDGTGLMGAQDQVRNAPGAVNRPKVMDIALVSEAELRYLCSRYSVAVFDRNHALELGMPPWKTGDLSGSRHVLREIGCGAPLPSAAR